MSTLENNIKLNILPGIILVSVQWLCILLFPLLITDGMAYGVGAGLLTGILFIVWWLFFSRAKIRDRWIGFLFMIGTMVGVYFLLDESIATGNMGLMYPIFCLPVMCLAFILWAIISLLFSYSYKRRSMYLAILIGSGIWIFLRTDGLDGQGRHDIGFRWASTSEKALLKHEYNTTSIKDLKTVIEPVAEWAGFRGPNRSGVIEGTQIARNWTEDPPEELWRRKIGPACSSIAIKGSMIYTQEQRGEYEQVSCYNLSTGEPVWKYRDKTRFWDSHAGAGPRSTPSLSKDYVYSLGGTGILNAIEAKSGSLVWSRNAASDLIAENLEWGFTGSPLIYQDVVIVSLAGKLAGYNTRTGRPIWQGIDVGPSYSSPQLISIDGIPQVIFMGRRGALSIDPGSGNELWQYDWIANDRILQPAVVDNGELILSEEAKSLKRVSIRYTDNDWIINEKWTTSEMKINFNDMVVHKGYAYGFHGPQLACLNLDNGQRQWKGNRYQGWLLLLEDQDLILVISEKGELALVEANPKKFVELEKIKVLDGKTWNHPAMVGNILLVRNSKEMAAYRLSKLSGNGLNSRPQNK